MSAPEKEQVFPQIPQTSAEKNLRQSASSAGDSPVAEKHLRSSVPSAAKEAPPPKISVIVPVYKVEKYLPECIESVLAQTFTDFELILVDDGSPDNCGTICDAYAARDPRVRVFHKENGGVTSARRLGVERSRGEWITFVDSDDKLFPNAFHDLSTTAEAHPDADLVEGVSDRGFSPIRKFWSEHEASALEYAEALASYRLFWSTGPWGKLLRRSVMNAGEAMNVPARFYFAEDFLMLVRFATKMRRAVKINSLVYSYRNNEEGACRSRRTAAYYADFLRECERTIPGGTEGEWGAVWRAAARVYFIAMFLVCDDWNPRDPYMRKIVRELSRRSRAYSVGTRLCLTAARLPPFAQPCARALLARLLRTKVMLFKK